MCPGFEEEIEKQRKQNVLMKVLKHEEDNGNSNNQPLELLKPKWVENDEIGRAKDSRGKYFPVQIVAGKDISTNPVIVISNYKYVKKRVF